MSSLREIKDRIGSVRSTLKITSAMKLVASAKLRKAQFIPLHSAGLPIGLTEGEYMKISLAMLDAADAIFPLPDWEDSQGAMIEVSMAVKSGKKFVREEPDGSFTVSG